MAAVHIMAAGIGRSLESIQLQVRRMIKASERNLISMIALLYVSIGMENSRYLKFGTHTGYCKWAFRICSLANSS